MPVTCGQVADRLERRAALEVHQEERRPGRADGAAPCAVSHARRNSLLPLPVVPATIACGPRPTRSSSSAPVAGHADGDAQGRTRAARRRRLRRASASSTRSGSAARRADARRGRRGARGRRPGCGLGRAEQFGDDRCDARSASLRRSTCAAGRRLHRDDRARARAGGGRPSSATAIDRRARGTARRRAPTGRAAARRRRGARLRRRRCGRSARPRPVRRPRGPAISTAPGRHGSRPARSGARAAARASVRRRRRSRSRSAGRRGPAHRRAAPPREHSRSAVVGRRRRRCGACSRTVPRPSTTCPSAAVAPVERPRMLRRCAGARRARRHAAARSRSCRVADREPEGVEALAAARRAPVRLRATRLPAGVEQRRDRHDRARARRTRARAPTP